MLCGGEHLGNTCMVYAAHPVNVPAQPHDDNRLNRDPYYMRSAVNV